MSPAYICGVNDKLYNTTNNTVQYRKTFPKPLQQSIRIKNQKENGYMNIKTCYYIAIRNTKRFFSQLKHEAWKNL
jgi:hypothetical protein